VHSLLPLSAMHSESSLAPQVDPKAVPQLVLVDEGLILSHRRYDTAPVLKSVGLQPAGTWAFHLAVWDKREREGCPVGTSAREIKAVVP
jgi:hypothetical protein